MCLDKLYISYFQEMMDICVFTANTTDSGKNSAHTLYTHQT